jgi:hypothetical protein
MVHAFALLFGGRDLPRLCGAFVDAWRRGIVAGRLADCRRSLALARFASREKMVRRFGFHLQHFSKDERRAGRWRSNGARRSVRRKDKEDLSAEGDALAMVEPTARAEAGELKANKEKRPL